MVSLNPERPSRDSKNQPQAASKAAGNNSDKTGTKFHPNNQVKADHPKKPSPFNALLKQYRYEGGEITRWFVDAWDQFDSFEQACEFMVEKVESKQYRYFCFPVDWRAILDKYLFVRCKFQTAQDAQQNQANKLFVKVGSSEHSRRSESIFEFTNRFISAASSYTPATPIRAAINYLDYLGEQGEFQTTEAQRTIAINNTLPQLHPECILEWVHALDLRISEEQFKSYAQ